MIDALKALIQAHGNSLPPKHRGVLFYSYKDYKTNRIVEGVFVMRGSLHKYFNAGKDNKNDFKYSDFVSVLLDLDVNLGVDSDTTRVQMFEFGLNIKTSQKPKQVLNRIILHNNKEPKRDPEYLFFEYKQYTLKIYSKDEKNNILRIEIHLKRKQWKGFNSVSILSDLLDVRLWEVMKNVLIEAVSNCLILDIPTKKLETLTDKEQIKYYQYLTPTFWTGLNKKDRYYYKKELNKFIEKYNGNALKNELIEALKSKAKEVLNYREVLTFLGVEKLDFFTFCETLKSLDLFTICKGKKEDDFKRIFGSKSLDLFTSWITGEKSLNSGISKTDQKTPKVEMLKSGCLSAKSEVKNSTGKNNKNTLSNEVKKEVIFCAGCGAMIENPRKNQKYCSAKVVGYEKAHQCRNNNSNPRNNTKRSFERLKQKYGNSFLFDSMDLIPERKRVYLRGA